MREATFPFISSNVYDARTNRPFGGVPPYGLTVIGGVKLGVFAATGTLGDPTLSRDVRVEDVPAAARRAVKDLKKKGAEVIVGITQQNLHDDRELAKSVPGIDILFGEEESSTVSVVEWVGHTAIAKSAANLGSVVRVDVRADKSAPRFAVLPVDSQIPEDLRLAALTSRVMGELAKHWTEVVGRVDVPLDARAESNRLGETALGDLIADAFRSYYDADVGLLNGGAIRSDQVIPRGRVTLRQIHELLPYRDRVVLLLVEGRDLKAAIEDGLRRYGASEGAFPHVSGLSYRFDPRKPAGGRIVEITANGVPLSDVSPLRVATRAYLAAGGDGYRALRRGKVAVAPALSPSETDVFAAYLRKNHPIAGVSARRIQNATDGDATNASAP